MAFFAEFKALNRVQRNTFAACFLGWTLDAFDFFLLTFCLTAIAGTFHVGRKEVAEALFWTLVMRPVGAFLFGAMAERYGRRVTLMFNVIAFSAFELLSAFAPTLPAFLACRALFGIAMGGVWGVGAALALETLPAENRGFFSGLLQEGYVCGNLLAAALFGLLFSHLHGHGIFANWRVMFMIGALPSLLVFHLRFNVEESPAWLAKRARNSNQTVAPERVTLRTLFSYAPVFIFLVILMSAFTSFSHGTQDLYPTFLQDHKLRPSVVGLVAAIGNVGALVGGIACGKISEHLGRRRTIVLASLLAIPMIPLWAWSHSAGLLALGGFLMQFMVQGAWGVIPAHLSELSPNSIRGFLPGFAYQCGALLAGTVVYIEAVLAQHVSFASAMAITAGSVFALAIAIVLLGPEKRGARFDAEAI